MSRTDILVEIKEAEANAKVIIEKAEADKKAAIANARRESVEKIQKAEADSRANFEKALADERKALESQRKKLLDEGDKEAKKLDKAVGTKMPKVKEFLNKEFERTLDVTS